MARLTPNEKEVAILIAKGLKNREIAAKLFISRRLVCKHVQSIKQKWNINSRVSIGIIVSYLGWHDDDEKTRKIISSYQLLDKSR